MLLLGIDYGSANIGLAFGRDWLVSPLATISGKDNNTAIKEIARYAMENKVSKIVIGLPQTADGKNTPHAIKVMRFAKLLKIRLKKPITFMNEFATTIESMEEAIETGISKKRRRSVDHLSAAIILKRYYAENSDNI